MLDSLEGARDKSVLLLVQSAQAARVVAHAGGGGGVRHDVCGHPPHPALNVIIGGVKKSGKRSHATD